MLEENTVEESNPLVASQAQIALLGRHKEQCQRAIILCGIGLVGDFVRLLLFLVFRGDWETFTLRSHKHMVIYSVTWDFATVFLCVGIYFLHHSWLHWVETGRWSWMNVMRASAGSRMITVVGMLAGASYNYTLSVFLFLLQLFFYAWVMGPWVGAIQMYLRALQFQPVAMQGITTQSFDGTPEMKTTTPPNSRSVTPPSPISPILGLTRALAKTPSPTKDPIIDLTHSTVGGFLRESVFGPVKINLDDSFTSLAPIPPPISSSSIQSSTSSQPFHTPPGTPKK